jgi:phosphoribosylglycinamide formyltransferase-1
MGRLKVAVLISGRGSNLQALIDACTDTAFPAKIVLVISNVADAPGLVRAKAAGIATSVIPHGKYPDRSSFDRAVTEALEGVGTELVCLAGFMRLLTERFCNHWRNQMINVHPSLLPAFKGLQTHARVLEAGVRISGCTVHFVRAEMDTGPIIVQAAVSVGADDTPESLAARVLEREHEIYSLALRLIGEGRVTVDGERASIDGADALIKAR